VLRVLRLLLACRISTIKDAAAMLRRDLPRLFQEHVRIAAEPDASHSAAVPVVQRERLAVRRDTRIDDRVEHLLPFSVRLQVIEIASGQHDGGHGVSSLMFCAQEVLPLGRARFALSES